MSGKWIQARDVMQNVQLNQHRKSISNFVAYWAEKMCTHKTYTVKKDISSGATRDVDRQDSACSKLETQSC